MFGQLLAESNLRRFLAECVRGARAALRDWFQSEDTCERRGLKLLREWLSPEQLAQYDANRYFDVTGCDTGTRYRIHHGASMNVHELDGAGRPHVGWCFAPKGHLVAGDVMLAQKIALETDERRALAVANNFFVQTGRRNTLLHH